MGRTGRLAALALLATAAAAPAMAVDNGLYLGAGVGQAGIGLDEVVDGESLDFDATGTGFKLIGGWRFLDWLAVEANYLDFGSLDDEVQGVDVGAGLDGFTVSVVGFLPIGPVDLFARAGAFVWNGDLEIDGVDLGDDDGTDLTYGVGAQFRVWSLSLRAEYERFDLGDGDPDLITVGVTWTFL